MHGSDSSIPLVTIRLLLECQNVLEDVEAEIGQDEVAELISMALDRKLGRVLLHLREYLNVEA